MIRPRFLSALCLGLAATAALAADRVDGMAALNVPAKATLAPHGSYSVGFLVTQGTGRNLVFSIKRGSKTSKLIPTATLLDPDGSPINIAASGGSVSKAGATAWSAKLPNTPKTGLYRLVVTGGDDAGGDFIVLIKGKDAFKAASLKTAPPTIPVNGKNDVAITAGENVALTVAAGRAKGSSINLQLTILDSNDQPVGAPAVVNAKSGALSLKAFRLPVFGAYKLRFSGGTSGGGFTYSISTAPAKIKGTIPVAVPLAPGSEVSAVAADAEPGVVRTFNGSGTGGTTYEYRWTQVGGPTVVMTNSTTSQPSFVPPDTEASLAFQLSVSSNGVLSKPATIDVQVGKRPIADAGRAQSVAASAAVTLEGGNSFSRSGKPLKYSWRQMPNDPVAVTLTGADTATPTFTAPNSVVKGLHFGLIVDDGRVRSGGPDEDVVVVAVGDPATPIADAGRNQVVPRMASVVLSCLGARTASGVLASGLQWTQTSGPTVVLADATQPWPSFTAPKSNADLQFKLTVAGEAATADSVWVHVRALETNLPAPARGTGPITVASGAATLTADATDPNNTPTVTDTVRFRWAQVFGPSAAPPSEPSAASTTASIPAGNAAYLFCAMTNDGLQYGSPDFVAVRNTGFNGGPIAIAGTNFSAASGAAASLDGHLSARTDGGPASGLTYQWTQLTGKDWFDFATGSSAFNATVMNPNVALPSDISSLTQTRTVVFQLVVNDGTNSSLPDLVTVTYTSLPSNGKPSVTASISDSNPLVGQTITLTGTAIDREGDPMTFQWKQLPGGTPVTLTGATTKVATFTAPASGTLTFSFTANDGIDDSLSPTTSTSIDVKPTANAVVSPLSGPQGTLVTMDATTSSDPDDPSLTYLWTQLAPASPQLVTNTTASIITFNAPAGTVQFRLVVNDGRQASDPKTFSFSSNLPPTVALTASRNGTIGVAGPASAITAAYGATVTLNANATGGSGTLSYTWRVVSQSPSTMPAPVLGGATSATNSFTVPLPTSTSGPFGNPSAVVASTPGALPPNSDGPRAVFGVTASDGTQTSPEGQVTVYFYASLSDTTQTGTTVYGSVIQANCTSCHGSGATSGASCPNSAGANYNLASKAAFLGTNRGIAGCVTGSPVRLPNLANVGQANSTYLYQRCSGAATPAMPQGTSGLTAVPRNLLKDWIDQGVQDN